MKSLTSIYSGIFLAITLVGCGDGGTGSTGSGGGSSTGTSTGTGVGGSSTSTSTGTGGPSSDVTGTLVDTYVTEAGDVPEPNLTLTPIAFVPAGDSFTMIPGTVESDGTFKIPNVPEGTYYLGLQNSGKIGNFIITDQRQLDLGKLYAGRPDAKPITAPATKLVLDATGLDPWQTGDAVEMYSLGATSGGYLTDAAPLAPNAGDTSLKAFEVKVPYLASPNQIEAAKGDTTLLAQLIAHADGTFGYQSIGKSFQAAGFSLPDGATTPLSGAFTDVVQQSATLDWKRSLFASTAALANPVVQPNSFEVYAYAEPGGPTRVTSTSAPTLLDGVISAVGVTDDVMLKLGYGNPFPASWSAMATVYMGYGVQYALPGTGTIRFATASLYVTGAIADLAAGPVEPVVGPPSALKVGANSAYAMNKSVGLTPVLSWSAPTLGTSAIYTVSVRKVDPMYPNGREATRIFTQGTSVTVPAGVLESGSSYFVDVTAQSAGAITAPFKPSPKGGGATAISGLFSP